MSDADETHKFFRAKAAYSAARDFYKNNFERFSIIRIPASFCYVAIILTYRKVRSLLRHTTGIKMPVKSMNDLNQPALQLLGSEIETIPEVTFSSSDGLVPKQFSSRQYRSPATFLWEFPNAKIIATTDFLIFEGCLVHDPVFSPKNHMSTLERFSQGTFSSNGRTVVLSTAAATRHLSKAINLTSGGSGNFAHFVNEVLPKIALIEDFGVDESIPIVLDDCLSENLKFLVKMVISDARKIIYAKRFEVLEVDLLLQINSASFAPLDVKKKSKNFGNFTIFSTKYVSSLRRRLALKEVNPEPQRDKKLYLSRSNVIVKGFQENASRHVHNQDEIESFLQSRGFIILRPERLTPAEMIDQLKSASIIVAPIGASLCNALFAPPETQVVALSPNFKGADFTYHSRMMAAYGFDYFVVLGRQKKRTATASPNHPYEIPIPPLERILDGIRLKAK